MQKIVYRDYQRQAHINSRALYDSGINRQLLVAATGVGKTIIFAALPQVFSDLAIHGTLILVHRDELVFQAVDKLRMVNPNITIGIEKAEYHADLSSDVIVASVQTLGHKSRGRLLPILEHVRFGIVIVDEVHHMKPGSQYDRILNEIGLGSNPGHENYSLPSNKPRLLFGVTATPNRHDKVGLSHFLDEIVLDFGIKEAVEQGYLTDIEHYVIKTGINISGVKKQAGDFQIGQLSQATNIVSRNNVIVSAYKKMSMGKTALAFCSSVDHAHVLAKVFREADIRAESIDAKTPRDLRRDILRRLEDPDGDIDIVTNFGVLTEGLDSTIHTILMARPTKSQPLYIQMMGRGLRTIPTDLGNLETLAERKNAINESVKPTAIVLDFIDEGHDVVTAPSLFGLAHGFDSKGKHMFGQTMVEINSAVEANPMNAFAIMQAGSFEEVAVETRRINIWTLATSYKSLDGLTSLRWQRLNAESVQIEVLPEDAKKFIVRLDQDYLGHWDCSVITPRRTEDGQWTPEQRSHVATYPDLELGLMACDRTLRHRYRSALPLIDLSARWRSTPPSAKQLQMLESFGIDTEPVASKGIAADLITAAKATGRKHRRGVWKSG